MLHYKLKVAIPQVAEILVQSLTIDMTPIPRKLARLYVISDILHNSSNSLPNAWKYRQVLEKLLPDVFDHLNLIYRSFPGRIKAETFKKQITVIVNVWSSFMVFSQNSIDDFNLRLVKIDEEELDGDGVPVLENDLAEYDDGVDGMVVEDKGEWDPENAQGQLQAKVVGLCYQSGWTDNVSCRIVGLQMLRVQQCVQTLVSLLPSSLL